MLDMLQYSFMQKAFFVGLLLAIIVPCIGTTVVLKRLSMIGDALAHTSLAGVAVGLLMGFNPVLGAMVACLVAAFGVEAIRKLIPRYAEISIALILSVGIGLAGLLSGFVENAAGFHSFLFGSIVAISSFETILIGCISAIVFLSFIFLYKDLFYIAFDEQGAAISGVPVRFVNALFTILTAVTVAVATRTVGALVVSSLMVVPVATGMALAKSYAKIVWIAVITAIISTLVGLTLSFYFGLKPGGTIVLTAVALCCLAVIVRFFSRAFSKKRLAGGLL